MDMDNRVLMAGERGTRGLHGNGKYNKDYILKKIKCLGHAYKLLNRGFRS